MRCETAQRLQSAALDEPLGGQDRAALDEHVRTCAPCTRFVATATTVRRQLRLTAVGTVPDIAGRVVEHIEADHSSGQLPRRLPKRGVGDRRRPWRSRRLVASAAAVFLAGFVAGAVFVGSAVRTPVMAAPIGQRALEVQGNVAGLSLQLRVIERGWHPLVPVRTYDATLGYLAPEGLDWRFDDTTGYPTPSWVENDGDLVTRSDATWSRGVAACPVSALPGCTPIDPRIRVVSNPEPFSAPLPAALDLVVPVRSFALSGPVEHIGSSTIAGRATTGVAVTAAQVDPLLDTLTRAGNWRELHPSDEVEVWLDDETLVPLALSVRASDDPARQAWAVAAGYDDGSEPILELIADAVAFAAPGLPSPPPSADTIDAGFRSRPPGQLDGPVPTWLPTGMRPYRAGLLQGDGPEVTVRTWTDGRAWIKVRSTDGWTGDRLFGVSTAVVQRRASAGAGLLYAADGGSTIALHGEDTDAVVTGSVAPEVLERVAGSLGFAGLQVPDDWAEASTTTLDQAAGELPGLLTLPAPEDFAAPAVRILGTDVVQVYTGPGARGFVLTQSPGRTLGPPLDAEVQAVVVRAVAARSTPSAGRLEWIEDETLVSLESETIPRDELISIAEVLRVHRASASTGTDPP